MTLYKVIERLLQHLRADGFSSTLAQPSSQECPSPSKTRTKQTNNKRVSVPLAVQSTYQVCVPGAILCPQTLEANTSKGAVQIQIHTYDNTLGTCSLLYLSCLPRAVFHPQTPYSAPRLQILRSLLCLELAQPLPSLAIKSVSFAIFWGEKSFFPFLPDSLLFPSTSLHALSILF